MSYIIPLKRKSGEEKENINYENMIYIYLKINIIRLFSSLIKIIIKKIYVFEVILIFMSIIQAKLLNKYNENVFIDGTFFVAPKAVYQAIVIRVHNVVEDCLRFHPIPVSPNVKPEF